MDRTIWIHLEPLDVLFFRDGRPFSAGTHGESGLPMPQTLAGAVRTALLNADGNCDFLRMRQSLRQAGSMNTDAIANAFQDAGAPEWIARLHIRGPWLCRKKKPGATIEPLFPVPVDIVEEQGKKEGHRVWQRFFPLNEEPPGWNPPVPGMRPLWRFPDQNEGKTRHPGGYLTTTGMQTYLKGDIPDPEQDHVPVSELYGFESRTGIAMDLGTGTAEEHRIYSAKLLSMKPGTGFLAALETDMVETKNVKELLKTRTVRFGGEGRHVTLSLPENLPPFPESKPVEGRACLVLSTPAIMGTNPAWLPPETGAKLIAAKCENSLAVSGWDLARGGPKPVRQAVPAGSVYYLEQVSTLPEHLGDNESALSGWGQYLTGTWKGV